MAHQTQQPERWRKVSQYFDSWWITHTWLFWCCVKSATSPTAWRTGSSTVFSPFQLCLFIIIRYHLWHLKLLLNLRRYNMPNTILITGANSSLAIPTIDYLLQHSPNTTLVLTVRDTSDNDANTKTLRSIIAKHSEPRVTIRELDLAHLAAVHDFALGIATEIAQGTLPRLSAIICTAFYWNLVEPIQTTDDGYERTIQINYLSHVALVLRLLSSFKADGGRIVLFTSDAHEPGKNVLEKIPPSISSVSNELDILVKPDVDSTNDALAHGMHRYANSKLALVLFTHALNRRLAQDKGLRNVTAVVMNPGNLADSRALYTNTPHKLHFLRRFILRPLLPLLRLGKWAVEYCISRNRILMADSGSFSTYIVWSCDGCCTLGY